MILWSSSLHADQVNLVNGDNVTGNMVGISNGKLSLDTENFGLLILPTEQVQSVETDELFFVIFDDGTSNDQKLDASIDLLSIIVARQEAKTSLKEGLRDWQRRVEASLVQTTGNGETQLFFARFATDLKKPNVEHLLKMAMSVDTADDVTQKEQTDINYGYRRYFREDWYTGVTLDIFRDPVINVDNRVSLAAGFGHRFWEHTYGVLTSELGLSQISETLTNRTELHLQLVRISLKSPPSKVSPSSSGLGHWVFIPATGVRLP